MNPVNSYTQPGLPPLDPAGSSPSLTATALKPEQERLAQGEHFQHAAQGNPALPDFTGYGAGPQEVQHAWSRMAPAPAQVYMPAEVSYAEMLTPTLAAWPAEHDGLPSVPSLVPGSFLAPPELSPPEALTYAHGHLPWPESEQGPFVGVGGPAQAPATGSDLLAPVPAARVLRSHKRLLSETSEFPPLKRFVSTELRPPATVDAVARTTPEAQAWPKTRPAGREIGWTNDVITSLINSGRTTRERELKYHNLENKKMTIHAIALASSMVSGTLVATHGDNGIYKFDNVVLKKGTKINRSKSGSLAEDKPIGTVYLELINTDGQDMLKDLRILIPWSEEYPIDEQMIVQTMKVGSKGNKNNELGKLAKENEKGKKPPAHRFKSDQEMHDYFRHHMSFFNTLGCKYPFQMKDLLRECENEMGGAPGDGNHRLTLKRDEQLFPVLWVVSGGYTTQLIDARDMEKAKEQETRAKQTRIGMNAAKLAKENLVTSAKSDQAFAIAGRHKDSLGSLHWGDQLPDVVRDLSLRCDTFRRLESTPTDDLVIDCGEEPEVEEFRLSAPSTAEVHAKTARGLRWVQAGKLKEIVLFEEGMRANAIETMREFKRQSAIASKRHATAATARRETSTANR